ncbi:class I SAM-dependent methyltransferase [Verrucomicrobiota bacterium]
MKPSEPNSAFLRAVRGLHARFVLGRRADRLAGAVSDALPRDPAVGSVLDVGCGDGAVGARLRDALPDLSVHGVEIVPRPTCAIDCTAFDGTRTTFPDASFDICTLIDVLHHTKHPLDLLHEARRCATRGVIVKDHVANNKADAAVLRFMDWVHNRPRGVPLPYSYLAGGEWEQLFAAAGLRVVHRTDRLGLYPFPFSLVFGRKLHFIARLEPS